MNLEPFIKWPGGKRWLAKTLVEVFRSTSGRYIEPFLGGGAVFFRLSPDIAYLGDLNRDLVTAYLAVRDQPHELIHHLHSLTISEEEFYRQRESEPSDDLLRAVRFLYLNRTAFNGLYRVNQHGKFNVPFGCKPGTVLCDADRILACSTALANATVMCRDFRHLVYQAKADDILYIDPPYTVRHNENGFRRYNERLFSWDDQLALAKMLNDRARNGVHIAISNAWHQDVLELYDSRMFICKKVSRRSAMSASPRYRGRYDELLAVSTSLVEATNHQFDMALAMLANDPTGQTKLPG